MHQTVCQYTSCRRAAPAPHIATVLSCAAMPRRERRERDWTAMAPWVRAYVAGYDALEDRLTAEGFRITLMTTPHPVQIMGYLPTGEGFFFYCKYGECRLGIASTDKEAVDAIEVAGAMYGLWGKTLTRWSGSEASYLAADQAEPLLRELLADYAVDTLTD